jgi:dipeptidyl aminopeptidase/acylaminoacyl peptidase
LSDRRLSWPEVSPDGKYIACAESTSLPRWRLTVIPFAGGEPLKSFSVPETAALARSLQWTLDGKGVLYHDAFQGLWRQALDEPNPQQVKGFEEVHLSQFIWSLDGKDLAYTSVEEMREIVLLENLK